MRQTPLPTRTSWLHLNAGFLFQASKSFFLEGNCFEISMETPPPPPPAAATPPESPWTSTHQAIKLAGIRRGCLASKAICKANKQITRQTESSLFLAEPRNSFIVGLRVGSLRHRPVGSPAQSLRKFYGPLVDWCACCHEHRQQRGP